MVQVQNYMVTLFINMIIKTTDSVEVEKSITICDICEKTVEDKPHATISNNIETEAFDFKEKHVCEDCFKKLFYKII